MDTPGHVNARVYAFMRVRLYVSSERMRASLTCSKLSASKHKHIIHLYLRVYPSLCRGILSPPIEKVSWPGWPSMASLLAT